MRSHGSVCRSIIENVFDDLPGDLERLRTLRVWHAMWLERIDRKIAAVEQRRAEEERGRRQRPEPPDWVAAFGIGASREPVEVHAGACHMTGPRWRAIDRDEARRLLSSGIRACSHCEPDVQLHILDLAARVGPPHQRGPPSNRHRRPGRQPAGCDERVQYGFPGRRGRALEWVDGDGRASVQPHHAYPWQQRWARCRWSRTKARRPA